MVLIDMDMPKCCKDCIFWNYYEGNCKKIKVSEWKDFDTDEEYEKRAYDCPLKSMDDVAPVIHAKWEDGICSNCHCDVPAYIIDWKWVKDMDAKYCPNCGAKMDKE